MPRYFNPIKMPAFGGSFGFSKAVLISSSVIMGSGTIYLLYHLYTFSKQLKRLNFQMTILTERLLRAEADIMQLQLEAGQNGTSDDADDDEFVDAQDADQEIALRINGSAKNVPPSNKSATASLEEMLENVDNKMEQGGITNLSYALDFLKDLSHSHPHEAEVFWRLSKAAFLLAEEDMLQPEHTKDRHKELMSAAQEAVMRAVALKPTSGNAHRWAAIVIGSLTQYMSTQEQIKSAYIIREHIEKAIKFIPKDSLPYYMMGRWCYSVYMLSWVERKLASALFASPPTATLEESLDYFEKAERLNPRSSVQNQLYLAKCYIAKQEYKMAVKYLEVGDGLDCSLSDDRKAHEEIQELLKQYIPYAS